MIVSIRPFAIMKYWKTIVMVVSVLLFGITYSFYSVAACEDCKVTSGYAGTDSIRHVSNHDDTPLPLVIPPDSSSIGFAFVLIVHNLNTIKAALVSLQLLQSSRCFFVVHVDQKVPEDDVLFLQDAIIARNLQNVKVISTRSIKWGGKELVPAALDGMTLALEEWPNWHYMFLLSGDCLPIKSLPEIQKQMSQYWPKNNLAIISEGIKTINEVNPTKQKRFKLGEGETYDSVVQGLEMVYFGTTWVTLARPFVFWMTTDSFAIRFLLYLDGKHLDRDPETNLPSIFEELYFQTVIMHSPFKSDVGGSAECIRFEKWGACNYKHEDRPLPCLLGENDTPDFNRTSCLFARKFHYSGLPEIISNRMN